MESKLTLRDVVTNQNMHGNRITSPFVIAEAGVNHDGNIDLAKRLIDEAKEGGADAIKFQTYKAEKIAVRNSPAYWDLTKEPISTQFQLFKKHDSFWKSEFDLIADYCKKADIEFLSTPFDTESAVFLNDLMDVFKISSSDLNNKPFIEFLCKFGKPIILSTGASFLSEVQETTKWIQSHGNSLGLLHCVLNYPTEDKNANLSRISELKRNFPNLVIGYSDHTLPGSMKNLELATLLGARIIEKHFTYDKSLPGNDHYHAMDKHDLRSFRVLLSELDLLLGDPEIYPISDEKLSRKNARRSLVAGTHIKNGATITSEMITWKRPANGIDPRDYDLLIGRTALVDINEDEQLQWSMFSE